MDLCGKKFQIRGNFDNLDKEIAFLNTGEMGRNLPVVNHAFNALDEVNYVGISVSILNKVNHAFNYVESWN